MQAYIDLLKQAENFFTNIPCGNNQQDGDDINDWLERMRTLVYEQPPDSIDNQIADAIENYETALHHQ